MSSSQEGRSLGSLLSRRVPRTWQVRSGAKAKEEAQKTPLEEACHLAGPKGWQISQHANWDLESMSKATMCEVRAAARGVLLNQVVAHGVEAEEHEASERSRKRVGRGTP